MNNSRKPGLWCGLIEIVGLALVLVASGLGLFREQPARDAGLDARLTAVLSRLDLVLAEPELAAIRVKETDEIRIDLKRYENLAYYKIPSHVRVDFDSVPADLRPRYERLLAYLDELVPKMERVESIKARRIDAAHLAHDSKVTEDSASRWTVPMFIIGSLLVAVGRTYEILAERTQNAFPPKNAA